MEVKESGIGSSGEALAKGEKNSAKKKANRKRKFKCNEDDNEKTNATKKKSLNGKLSSKKRKKIKGKLKIQDEDQTCTKPSLTLQLKSYFKRNKKGLHHLKIKDLQGLIIYCLLRKTCSEHPSWCHVAHRRKIKKVVVILLRAVGENDFLEYPTCFPFIVNEFSSSVAPINAEGTDFSFKHVHETLLTVPLSKSQLRKKRKKLQEEIQSNGTLDKILGCNLDQQAQHTQQESLGHKDVTRTIVDKSVHLLTSEQLKSNKYPLRCFDDKAHDKNGFLPCVTKDPPSAVESQEQPVYAVDCEMCVTSEGYELTRISIIDESMNVLYDTLVKPHRPILDYKTEYSGITAESLDGVTVTLEDVQTQVQTILPHGAILAGHSLECDLNALKMYHNQVIDTAISYKDKRGGYFKPALKFLAEFYLKKKIQNGTDGHCSIEDAKTCMELVKLKFQEGPDFGLFGNDTEGLFDRMDCELKTCSMLDYPYIASSFQTGSHNVVPCTSDNEIVSKAGNLIKSSHFTWIHLHGAQQFYDGLKGHAINEERKEEMLKELDSNVRDIYQDTPENSLTLVIMGCGDVSQVRRLQKDPEPRTEELRKAVREARKGLCFMKIT